MSVDERYTLQCIINGQSRVTEKTPIKTAGLYEIALFLVIAEVQPHRKDT